MSSSPSPSSSSRWTSCLILLQVLNLAIAATQSADHVTEDHRYWLDLGREDILRALSEQRNTGIAKNVILFVGDGMGLSTVTAARIYGKTERGRLAFENFPNIGTLKTYSADKIVPDSCSTATALFSGIKANQKTSGVDYRVVVDDCEASLKPENTIDSMFVWAKEAGKSTGFVTTTRVTHATPSALYAHTSNRNWECEDKIPKNAAACKDIARQLVEDLPGRDINVIMGGGRQNLQSNVVGSDADPIDPWSCYSKDGRDLIADWTADKNVRNFKHRVVQNNEELAGVDHSEEFLLGVFANGHLKMEHERDQGPKGMPSLRNMTEAAIKNLMKNPDGFLLMVEGGLIDFAHHRGHAKQALSETMAFNDAIERALELTKAKASETLIIVTSDHSHPLVISGYADRSVPITGIAQNSKFDGVPYTTLLYGTGGPDNYKFFVNQSSVARENPALVNTDDINYAQQAAILTDEVAHEGSDVLVYATGPMAHLFHSVHEQTYVAHVISYASGIGPQSGRNDGHRSSISHHAKNRKF
ncbi:PREDICTED: alkaline phosphatase-like isoform X2 [Nicrophorus vespilloides]|uniref:alkaline phosphatase n=1 Tax=Nicrophorus vespilloides TaxID=110193 RepID=A0ABM1MAY0_NICVS|nr:PREDICTED: alkaline phosphatase-like isoform X2 [Nicrophorus vespilloides]